MKERKVNLDYLSLYQEIPLFCAVIVSGFFRKKPRQKTNATLIVSTCLIGEFVASVSAIRDYILRNEHSVVDLMVSPPLVPLAEKIRGVRRVYTARSLYGRLNENGNNQKQTFDAYDLIFLMRISTDAYRLIRTIPATALRTGLNEYSAYGIHLWWSVIWRKSPKQWIELNFDMLGGTYREIPFDDLFQFSESEYASIKDLQVLQTTEKKVVIHTGAGWSMKKWNNDKWADLLQLLHNLGPMRFLFVGGAEDADDYENIASHLAFPVYSLIGKINLLQLLLVLRNSEYFIGTDSGPGNMAHLADTRSVAIFGPGPHFYMPQNKNDVVIDKSRGRGLFQMFFASKKRFIDQITADEVYNAFGSRLWNL
jgi:ADP-heptose:LPS heptosyltransferase